MFQPICTDSKDNTLFQVYEILYLLFLWSITFMKFYVFWYFIFLLVPWVKNVTKWICRTFETFGFLYWKHASLISISNLQEWVIFFFSFFFFFFFFFFERKFKSMASAPNNSSLLSDQDTNKFLVLAWIEPQISYTTIKDFIGWANWNPVNLLC